MKYIYLFTIILITSCTSNTSRIDHLNNNCTELDENQRHLKIKDNLEIEVPDNAFGLFEQYSVYDSLVFGISRENPWQIDVVDLRKRQYIDRINLDVNFANESGPIYVHSLDSIFIIEGNLPMAVLKLINRSGQLIDKWNLKGAPCEWSEYTSEDEYTIWNFSKASMHVSENSIDLSINSLDLEMYNNLDGRNILGTYSLTERQWSKTFGQYEGIYLTKKKNEAYPFYLNLPYFISDGENKILSFPMTHQIYVYGEGNTPASYCIGSKYIDELPDMINSDILSDPYLSDEYVTTNPWYGPVFYHEDAELYSRIAIHKGNHKYRRGSSIVVFNKKFEVIDELFLDKNGTYSVVFNYPIPLPDGFLVALNAELLEEDVWAYQGVFRF